MQEAPMTPNTGPREAAGFVATRVRRKGIQVVGHPDDIYREPELDRMSERPHAALCSGPVAPRGALDEAGGKARAADVPNQDQWQVW